MVSAKVVEETQVVVEEEVVQNQSTSFDIDIKAAEAKIGVSVLMDDSIDGKGESRRVVLYSLELFQDQAISECDEKIAEKKPEIPNFAETACQVVSDS